MSKILVFAGSNNKNLMVANEFKKNLTSKGMETDIIDLVSLNLPLYTPDAEELGIPEEVHKYKAQIKQAQGFVFSVPEYNGGVPPVVTNFLAWISRSGGDDWREAFNGKPAAIASFSGGGGFQVLISLRTQLSYIGLNTIGRQVRATYKEDLNLEDVDAVSDLLIKAV